MKRSDSPSAIKLKWTHDLRHWFKLLSPERMIANERRQEAKNLQRRIQSQSWPGSGARGEDDQRNRTAAWRTPGGGRAVEEGNSGTSGGAVRNEARPQAN